MLLHKLKKIFLGSLLRRIFIILILLMAAGMVDYHFYASNNYKNWTDRKWMLHDKLSDLSSGYKKELYKYTNYFYEIADGKIKKEDFERHEFNSYYNGEAGSAKFVIVNNKTGKVFWDYWALVDLKIYGGNEKDIDKNIEAYVKKISYVYNREGEDSASIPSPKNSYKEKIETVNVVAYYWLDKRDPSAADIVYNINLKIKKAYENVAVLIVLISVIILYFLSLLIYIRNSSTKKFLFQLKEEFLETKRKVNFISEKLSFKGAYKKAGILFSVTLIFYLITSYIAYGGRNFGYFIKQLILLKEPLILLSISFIFIVFMLTLKKIKHFKYLLECTRKMGEGDLTIEIKESGDYRLDKLSAIVNSIGKGYEKAFKEGVKVEKAKTELIANVSHDLKTPLTSILTYVDLLRRNSLSKEEKEEYAKIVEIKTEKLNGLISDLIEASEVKGGKVKLNKEKIDMVALIHQVIGEHSNYYEEKNIKFKVKSFREEVMLYVDGKRMSRLVGNIVANSIKYSMPDTHVYIELEEKNKEIIISFKSISEEEMKFDVEEIFQRFKRGDESRNSKIEGSGLGLAIAKGIAELHGGRMYAEKEGDLFKMYLILMEG